MKQYVLGFRINADGVLLILKNKPEWQRGLYNGIGGSVESGETATIAMCREFEEETGIKTKTHEWNKIAIVNTDFYTMSVFYSNGDFKGMVKECDEGTISILKNIPKNIEITADWLLRMILDTTTSGSLTIGSSNRREVLDVGIIPNNPERRMIHNPTQTITQTP